MDASERRLLEEENIVWVVDDCPCVSLAPPVPPPPLSKARRFRLARLARPLPTLLAPVKQPDVQLLQVEPLRKSLNVANSQLQLERKSTLQLSQLVQQLQQSKSDLERQLQNCVSRESLLRQTTDQLRAEFDRRSSFLNKATADASRLSELEKRLSIIKEQKQTTVYGLEVCSNEKKRISDELETLRKNAVEEASRSEENFKRQLLEKLGRIEQLEQLGTELESKNAELEKQIKELTDINTQALESSRRRSCHLDGGSTVYPSFTKHDESIFTTDSTIAVG